MRIAVYCSDCMERLELPPPSDSASGEVSCSSPSRKSSISFSHSPVVISGEKIDSCSRCKSTAFYVQKDFDQRVGCAVLALGAALALLAAWKLGGVWLVPVLLVFAALDFVLARRVPPVVICYRCDTEYRDVPDAGSYKPYDPHVAERDAEVKTVRAMNP
ncbi:MAG TPA: hypothetical protein PLB01_06410 [Thermoanaerobaculia bacterium]|nr:hypothetical protein [Thermoanaerobaculia bacterium]